MMCGGMMLLLIPGAISNSNAVIRQEFRKLRFQMIDDSCSAPNSTASAKHFVFLSRVRPFLDLSRRQKLHIVGSGSV